ncbi:MAG: penicillin-binding transpeptidase domain-containing protein, partial [Opitutaceae bacterium]
ILRGSARNLNLPAFRIPGVSLAGKTGTARRDVYKDKKYIGKTNIAWFICFAPSQNPEIAIAVTIEGDKVGEDFYGGAFAAPVASAILRKYFEKKAAAARPGL